ncbi:MAG: hypothetical protein ABR581_08045 [Thermoleophilaceae bacterium]
MRPVLSWLRRLPWALFPVASAIALSACGGGGGDATKTLDRAFNHRIDSADLKLQGQIDVEGSRRFSQPLSFQAAGPFRAGAGKLPSARLDVSVGTRGGQTVSTGFASTGDRVFLKFQDVYYEQPAAVVRKMNESFRRGPRRQTSLGALGLDARSWLEDAKREGVEQVAGVKTEHVSGRLKVATMLRDFNGFVRRSGGAIGSAAGQPPVEALSSAELRQVAEVVKDPSFDVYVGKDDGTLRRISGRVELQVPERDRERFGGTTGGTIQFSIEFSRINREQKIQAPASARPLSELTQSLGGPGPPPTAPGRPEALKKYGQCLDKAKPGDTDALQRCSRLLP